MSSPEWRGLGGEAPIASRFLLEIDGVEIGIFSEVSGLELSVSVTDYEEGGQNAFAHKLPGRMSWPHLVFKRGLCDSDALLDWVSRSSGEGFAAASNTLTRSTGAITVVDSGGRRLRSWNVRDAFPVKWTGPSFDAQSSQTLDEQLEVAHHGFTAKTP